MVSEAQKKASEKYKKENTKQYKLMLSLKYDADIIAMLDSVGNRQGYLKSLIRADIARANSEKMKENNQMKTRSETINDLYIAWTQGGYPELYRNRTECRDWLEGLVNEDDPEGYFRLNELSEEELSALADELCNMYEKESTRSISR